MKTNGFKVWLIGLLLAGSAEAALTTNNWFLFSGKWEDGTKWSAGVPNPTNAVNTITNDLSSIVVTIDTGTVTQHVINSCMTISNLVVGRGSVISHTLFMNNANNTPGNIGLTILNSFTLNATGILSITNSDLRVTAPGGGIFDNGTALLNSGNIVCTNLSVGRTGVGTLTVSNGTLVSRNLNVAELPGSQGTFTIAGGSVTSRNLSVATSGLTGAVWLTGGQLTVSNESTAVGDPGIGQMTISNGTWEGSIMAVRQGTLTIAGGSTKFWSLPIASGASGLTATVWVVGGSLTTTNTTSAFPGGTNDTVVGLNGIGVMTISNGSFLTRRLFVGTNTNSQGTFTVAGGTNRLLSSLHIGSPATGTVWLTGGQLIVSNDVTQIGAVGVGQMILSNGMFLASDVYVGTNTGSQGMLIIAGDTNSLLKSSGSLSVGHASGATGAVWVTGGSLIVTSSQTTVAFSGVGQLTVSNGTWRGLGVVVGRSGGSRGTLTIAGGTNFMSGTLDVGMFVAATGAVWVTDGALIATNSGAVIGDNGVGQMTISNGVYRTLNVVAGSGSAASGTLTFAGGTTDLAAIFLGSNSSVATGTLWLTGGELLNPNGTFVGLNGVGRMTVSNGTWQGSTVIVAGNAGSKGTLNINGGTNFVSATMIIGNVNCTSTGIVTMAGGFLYITNEFGFGSLDVRSGTFTMSGGTVIVDTFFLTNACGHFARTGGTLIYSNAVLVASRDDDGDGIPNSFDPFPLDAANANADSDGDGLTDLQEFQAGTNPTNSASFFGITAIARESNDIRVSWMTGVGKTNALERTAGAAGSFATNNFSAIFTVTNSVGTTTNYLDVGAATNTPSLYYRVRLVP